MRLFVYLSVFVVILLAAGRSDANDYSITSVSPNYEQNSALDLNSPYNPFTSVMSKLSEYDSRATDKGPSKKYQFTSRNDHGVVVAKIKNTNYSGAPDSKNSRVVLLADDRKDITPAEMTMQYRYQKDKQTNAYLGAGANYQAKKIDYYRQETSKNLDSIGYVVEAGTDYDIDKKTSVNLGVKRNLYDREVSRQALTPGGDAVNKDWTLGTSVSYKLN